MRCFLLASRYVQKVHKHSSHSFKEPELDWSYYHLGVVLHNLPMPVQQLASLGNNLQWLWWLVKVMRMCLVLSQRLGGSGERNFEMVLVLPSFEFKAWCHVLTIISYYAGTNKCMVDIVCWAQYKTKSVFIWTMKISPIHVSLKPILTPNVWTFHIVKTSSMPHNLCIASLNHSSQFPCMVGDEIWC